MKCLQLVMRNGARPHCLSRQWPGSSPYESGAILSERSGARSPEAALTGPSPGDASESQYAQLGHANAAALGTRTCTTRHHPLEFVLERRRDSPAFIFEGDGTPVASQETDGRRKHDARTTPTKGSAP